VARLTDVAKRKELVEKLLSEVPGCGFKRPKVKEPQDKLSRITAGERILDWDDDEEPEAKEVRESVKRALDELSPKLERLALVLKPLVTSDAPRK
jgi:hypothetical protein